MLLPVSSPRCTRNIYFRINFREALAVFGSRELRGEFVCDPAMRQRAGNQRLPRVRLKQMLQDCLAKKMSKKDAVAEVAGRLHLPKNIVYRSFVRLELFFQFTDAFCAHTLRPL